MFSMCACNIALSPLIFISYLITIFIMTFILDHFFWIQKGKTLSCLSAASFLSFIVSTTYFVSSSDMTWHDCMDHSHIALITPSIARNEWRRALDSTETSGARFCLTCFLHHIPSMFHIELLTNVKLLTELFSKFNVSKDDTDTFHSLFHGGFVLLRRHFSYCTRTLLEVVESLVRHVCGLSCDKQIVALTACLKKMIIDFATLLMAFQEPTFVLPSRSSLGCSKVAILGADSNEEPSLNALEQYLEEIQQPCAPGCSLSHLASMLVRLLQDMFSRVKNAEIYFYLLLLSDVYESCAALRAASCNYILDFLRLYTTEALSRESSRTLEVYLYLLHQLFIESRQRPDYLENLSKAFLLLSSPLSTEPEAPFPSQPPVFICNLCATIENHTRAQITIRNALSLIHFVVSLETTSEVVFGDPNDPAHTIAVEFTLHHVTPLILHFSAELSLLACDTVRLLIKRQTALCISGSTREWIMDLALEGIQLGSKPSVSPLIGLLNILCDGPSMRSDVEAAFEPTAGANPNALVFIIKLYGFANDAFQDAMNGSFLREYFRKNAANVDTYAEQILNACGKNSSLPFQSLVRLLYLLSDMAANVAAIRPEVSSLLVHYTLRRLETELASFLGFTSSFTTSSAGKLCSTLEVLFERSDRTLSNWLGRNSFQELLHTVSHFLSASDELPSLAVQLLAEVRQGFPDWSVMDRVEPRECVVMLSLAHRLLLQYIAAKGIAGASLHWWCSRLRRLLQEGLLDWLLFISVGYEDEDVERQRGCLIQSVLREDGCVIDEGTTRGAASCRELLLRGASSQQNGCLLVSLAILCCPAPLDKDDMSTLLFVEFGNLVQLLVDHQQKFSEVSEQSQLDSGAVEDTLVIRPELSAIMDALSSVLSVSAVYYRYFGFIPEDLSLGAAVTISDPADGDGYYAVIVCSLYLRQKVRQLMSVLDCELCRPEPVKGDDANCDECATGFSNGQLLEELLHSHQLGRFALHILLAQVITGLHDASMVRLTEEALWLRWLSAAAAPDAGNTLFGVLFQFMREFYRRDSTKQVSLLHLLDVWVHSLDSCKTVPLRVCLLERHIIPYILTDRSRSCPCDVVSSMAVLLISTLSPIPPTQSSACDVVIFKWCVHALTVAWTTADSWHDVLSQEKTAHDSITSSAELPLPLNILVLLHLLLERVHGCEMSQRYGEALLPVLSDIQNTAICRDMKNGGVRGFHAATVALVCGLLKDRLHTDSLRTFAFKRANGGGSLALTTESLRRCWVCLPVLQCCELVRHECKESQDDERIKVLLLSLKAQVVSAFQFIFFVYSDRSVGNMIETECVCDGSSCSDDEYHASLCVVNWCMELVLARDTVWAEPSCHVIYALFKHYRATLATSQEVLSLYLCCLRCGPSMLSATQLGVLLSALLFAAPHLPWSKNGDAVHRLVRHFLTTVDPTALSSDLACSQSSQGTINAEGLSVSLGSASAAVKMYEVLNGACRYYAQAIPQAAPLSLHRLADFLTVSPCSVEGSFNAHLFVQKQENVNLFLQCTSL